MRKDEFEYLVDVINDSREFMKRNYDQVKKLKLTKNQVLQVEIVKALRLMSDEVAEMCNHFNGLVAAPEITDTAAEYGDQRAGPF